MTSVQNVQPTDPNQADCDEFVKNYFSALKGNVGSVPFESRDRFLECRSIQLKNDEREKKLRKAEDDKQRYIAGFNLPNNNSGSKYFK